jgi:hypothetical protein
MQTSYHTQDLISIAKLGGVMPSCWYAIESSLSNDRLLHVGSEEIMYS